MNHLREFASCLCLASVVAGCNPNFAFDVPDAASYLGEKGMSDAGATGASDAGTYEQCAARCTTWNQVCAPDWLVCVECNSDADCAGPGKRRCWAEDHRCVACATDTDCAAGQHCVSQTGECRTACNFTSTDDVCSTDGEHCGNSDVCLSCESDAECTSTGRGKHCLPGCGYCVACLTDADCAGSGLKCDTVIHSCVTCKDGRDCASGCCNIVNHVCY